MHATLPTIHTGWYIHLLGATQKMAEATAVRSQDYLPFFLGPIFSAQCRQYHFAFDEGGSSRPTQSRWNCRNPINK